MLNFAPKSRADDEIADLDMRDLVSGFSIEVMPRTAAKIEDFRALLPEGTRVYIAHIEGTPIEDMVDTAKRLRNDGFPVMPHLPARAINGKSELDDWVRRYVDVGVDQALLLGGGVAKPYGDLTSSIDMIETGLFDRHGFKRLHVAGHPEGNKDIDREGSTVEVDKALQWKQAYSNKTDAEMAIVTQFAFDAKPVIKWVERLQAMGVTLPVHVGVAGPTKLQTLLKYAVSCGVGPSIKVLQKRAMDIRKLMLPYEPTEVLTDLAAYCSAHPDSLIEQIHMFPLGGIKASAEWANKVLDRDAAND